MEINFPVVGLIALAIIILITFIIIRNRKDQKELEEDLNKSELNPDKHDPANELD